MQTRWIAGVVAVLITVLGWSMVSHLRRHHEPNPKESKPIAAHLHSNAQLTASLHEEQPTPIVAERPAARPLDLAKLRQAVQKGAWKQVRDSNGSLTPDDASTLHLMIHEIPPDLEPEKREAITHRLIDLLGGIPGEESSALLLDFVTRGSDAAQGSWRNAVRQLGARRFAPAAPELESRAFSGHYMGWYPASAALLSIEPSRYLGQVTRAMLANPDAATHYLNALSYSTAYDSDFDLTQSVPALQRFLGSDHSQARHHRPLIVAVLLQHVLKSKSESVKSWLVSSLQIVLGSADGRYSDEEKAGYREVLGQLEGN